MQRAVCCLGFVGMLACGDSTAEGGAKDSGSNDASMVSAGSDASMGLPGACSFTEQENHGEGTYYAATGAGNCGFDPTPNDLMVGAMNQTDYANSAVCGSCAEVMGPMGTVRVRIVDRCPECKPGDIDLSPQAFEMIAPLKDGRVPLDWHYIPCDVSGGIVIHFKDGSNAWWVAVQVRNHRLPIARLEARAESGQYQALTRAEYNYFIADSGLGMGPFVFRITDVAGNVVEVSDVPLLDDRDSPTSQQFPECL